MTIHLFIGALAMAGFFLLVDYARKKEINVKWWQWALTVAGILYTVFVLEMIIGFLGEGTPQAALVIGSVAGIVAIIWGVLLRRFVFGRKGVSHA